jgi:integrase/recombinase XerC
MSLRVLSDRSEYLLPASKAAYGRALERFERFAGLELGRYSAATVEAFRDSLKAQGLAPGTVNKHVYAIRWASKRLAQLGQGADFASGAEGVRNPEAVKRRALTLPAFKAVLATCPNLADPRDARDRALLVSGVRIGLRVSELCRMTWNDVAAGVVRGVGKGGHQLEAVIDPEAGQALGDWRRWLEAHGGPRRGPVFRSIHEEINRYRIGDRSLSRVAAHRIIAGRGAQAGVALSAHLLRHTFVTWALEAGVPPWRIMRQTGQRRLETLMKYAHDLRAAEDPVGGYLPSVL